MAEGDGHHVPEVVGLKLLVACEGDRAGVLLRAYLHAGNVPEAGPAEGWDHRVVIRSPERSLRESSHGSGTAHYARRRDCWEDWIGKLAAATAMAPGVRFEAIAELTADEG